MSAEWWGVVVALLVGLFGGGAGLWAANEAKKANQRVLQIEAATTWTLEPSLSVLGVDLEFVNNGRDELKVLAVDLDALQAWAIEYVQIFGLWIPPGDSFRVRVGAKESSEVPPSIKITWRDRSGRGEEAFVLTKQWRDLQRRYCADAAKKREQAVRDHLAVEWVRQHGTLPPGHLGQVAVESAPASGTGASLAPRPSERD